MKRFAEIDAQDTVANIIVAETGQWVDENLEGRWVEIEQAGVQVGWLYSEGLFSAPPAPEPAYRTTVTTAEFVELFTPAEYMAAEALLGVDPLTTQLYKVAELQGTVDLTSPKVTQAALPNFVVLGVLTQERADEIALGILE